MKEELLHIKKELSKKLKKERFEHTVGVMYTSASLAMRYGANIEKAMLPDCFMIAENIVPQKSS